MTCTCTMAQKLVGDGCYKCNPELHIDHLKDELDEVRRQRDELLEALKEIASPTQTTNLLWWQIKARSAIAKVENEK